MPYTRNTRIKVVHKKHEDIFIAQVEYRVPFAGTTWWDNYYPSSDNVGKVFSNDRDAYKYLEEMRQQHRNSDWVFDNYEVFVYELED